MTTFVGGRGDVLISYENEAITAQQSGQAVIMSCRPRPS